MSPIQDIRQRVVFRDTPVRTLYNLYTNARLHSLVTEMPARISVRAGDTYSAYGDYIEGRNILVQKNELIIQTWRASDWTAKDRDSILVLRFEQKGRDAIILLLHAMIPSRQATSLAKGWNDYYWKPWKKFLAQKRGARLA